MTNQNTRNQHFQTSLFHNIKLVEPITTVGNVGLFDLGSLPPITKFTVHRRLFLWESVISPYGFIWSG